MSKNPTFLHGHSNDFSDSNNNVASSNALSQHQIGSSALSPTRTQCQTLRNDVTLPIDCSMSIQTQQISLPIKNSEFHSATSIPIQYNKINFNGNNKHLYKHKYRLSFFLCLMVQKPRNKDLFFIKSLNFI